MSHCVSGAANDMLQLPMFVQKPRTEKAMRKDRSRKLYHSSRKQGKVAVATDDILKDAQERIASTHKSFCMCLRLPHNGEDTSVNASATCCS